MAHIEGGSHSGFDGQETEDLEDTWDHQEVDGGWVAADGWGARVVEGLEERGRSEGEEEGKVGGWRNKVVEKGGVGVGEGGGMKVRMAVDGCCGGGSNRWGGVSDVDVTL